MIAKMKAETGMGMKMYKREDLMSMSEGDMETMSAREALRPISQLNYSVCALREYRHGICTASLVSDSLLFWGRTFEGHPT